MPYPTRYMVKTTHIALLNALRENLVGEKVNICITLIASVIAAVVLRCQLLEKLIRRSYKK
jgi:hypothetical protein